jgi:hypothetical protein
MIGKSALRSIVNVEFLADVLAANVDFALVLAGGGKVVGPAVTDRPSGSRHALRTMRPGCAGFFMGMSLFSLVPSGSRSTLRRVKTITGKIKRVRRCSLIENRQNLLNRVHPIGPYPAPMAAFVEPFQAPVLEAPNHQSTL